MILYSRNLSHEQYGSFQTIWMYLNIGVVILSFGLPTLIFSVNLDAFVHSIKKNLGTLLSLYIILCIVIGVIIVVSPDFSWLIKAKLFFFILFVTTTVVIDALLVKYKQEKSLLIINFLYSFFFLACHYYNLSPEFNINRLLNGLILISGLKASVCFYILNGNKS